MHLMRYIVPVSEGVCEKGREERNAGDGCTAVAESQHEQRLVRVKVNHTHLIGKKLRNMSMATNTHILNMSF